MLTGANPTQPTELQVKRLNLNVRADCLELAVDCLSSPHYRNEEMREKIIEKIMRLIKDTDKAIKDVDDEMKRGSK